LSYTDGIGASPLASGVAEAAASSSTGRATRTESATLSAPRNEAGSVTQLDKASVSSAANMVAQALSGSDVRTEKVAALQQSIAAGTYNVPSSDVAAKVFSALLI
jgi:negative regulator of flagellin synthesis FlgM